jgi:hypothetical protein
MMLQQHRAGDSAAQGTAQRSCCELQMGLVVLAAPGKDKAQQCDGIAGIGVACGSYFVDVLGASR